LKSSKLPVFTAVANLVRIAIFASLLMGCGSLLGFLNLYKYVAKICWVTGW
jgi:hypothetical protein